MSKLSWVGHVFAAVAPIGLVWLYTESAVATLWALNATIWGVQLGMKIAARLNDGT